MDYDKLCMGCMRLTDGGDACPYCGHKATDQVHDPRCLPPKTILNGQYLVGKVLGQGGFGVTYIALDLNLENKVAIKEYMPDGLVTRTLGENTVTAYSSSKLEHFEYGMGKFLDEAKMMAKFSDVKSIVSVKNFFKENGTAYFVMDFIEGTNLAQYVQSKGGKIPLDEALSFMTDVIDALAVVHRNGMLHRDISPDNIYLTKDGTIKLLDFGAARYAMGEQSKSLSIILKPGYAPEEQYRSKGVQGAWTDIYATAATLYRMITGQLPPESMDRLMEDELIPPSQLGVAITANVENAILKALAVRAENRFQTMEDFKNMLIGGGDATAQEIPAYTANVKINNETVAIPKQLSPEPIVQAPSAKPPAQEPVSVRKPGTPGKKVLIVLAAVFIVGAGILTGVLLSNKKLSTNSGNTNTVISPKPTEKAVSTSGTGVLKPEPTVTGVVENNNIPVVAAVDPELARADEENCANILNTIQTAVREQDLKLPLKYSEEVTDELILRNKELPVVQRYPLGYFEIRRDASEVRSVQGNGKTSEGWIRIGGNDKYYSDEFEGLSRDTVSYDGRYLKTYDRQYQITVPGDWEDIYISDISVDLCAGIETDGKYTLAIFDPIYSDTMTMEEMIQSVEASINIDLNESVTGYEKIKLGGYDGFRFEVTENIEGIELTYLFSIIQTEEDIAQLISWTAAELYADYRDEYIRIHDSFQVNHQYFD
ncbi:MAG: serine/threonine protein kinase [Ruminiclostridium sp.]|nr:serine/threonine protein kinase [Ruminiclostridium sp.]